MNKVQWVKESRWFIIKSLLIIGFLCWTLFFASNYHLFQMTMVASYAIALLGLNLIVGYNGQFSLGHSAFFALGGYLVAIMAQHWGISYVWSLPIAGLVVFFAGLLVGIPALRLEGIYLAVTTYALVISLPSLLKYFDNWTGGAQGIILTKPQVPQMVSLGQDQWLYLVVVLIAIVLYWFGWNIIRARPGRAIKAIRDNPTVAALMGVNVSRYKTITFGLSAAYAGIGGGIGTIAIQFISPDQFSLQFAMALLVGIVLGGLATITGCIYGAFFIFFIPNISESVSKSAPEVIFGVILILLVYLMPTGLSGFITKVSRLFNYKK